MEHRAVLATLHPRERDILAVLALQKEPVARTPWLASVSDARVRDDAGRRLAGPTLQEVAERLVELGVVELLPRLTQYRLARGWCFAVLDDARERGTLAALVPGALGGSASRTYGIAPGPALLASLALRDAVGAVRARAALPPADALGRRALCRRPRARCDRRAGSTCCPRALRSSTRKRRPPSRCDPRVGSETRCSPSRCIRPTSRRGPARRCSWRSPGTSGGRARRSSGRSAPRGSSARRP